MPQPGRFCSLPFAKNTFRAPAQNLLNRKQKAARLSPRGNDQDDLSQGPGDQARTS